MNKWWLIRWSCGGILEEHAVVHWMNMWWLIGWTCGGSFDKHVEAHCGKMLWLIGSKILWLISENFVVYSTLLDEHVVVRWINMWWLIRWTHGGSLVRRVVAHWMNFEHVVAHLLRLAYWLKMWRLIGSAPDNWVPGYESSIFHNDHDALQDYCAILKEKKEL